MTVDQAMSSCSKPIKQLRRHVSGHVLESAGVLSLVPAFDWTEGPACWLIYALQRQNPDPRRCDHRNHLMPPRDLLKDFRTAHGIVGIDAIQRPLFAARRDGPLLAVGSRGAKSQVTQLDLN